LRKENDNSKLVMSGESIKVFLFFLKRKYVEEEKE